jgi:hypothetical protein
MDSNSRTTALHITFRQLRQLLADTWPEAVWQPGDTDNPVFCSDLLPLDTLFAGGGIPAGQVIEITGGPGCGKTSLALRLLARASTVGTVGYIDRSGSFFVPAAVASGVRVDRLVVVRPDSLADALRSAELLFDHHAAGAVICDIIGETAPLSETLLHRLRRRTVRARSLMVLLTRSPHRLLPPSLVSLRLEVTRRNGTMIITVSKSRICREGLILEVPACE